MKLQGMLFAAALALVASAAPARNIENDVEQAARVHDVQVQLQPERAFVPATDDVRMSVTFVNNGRHAVPLTSWFVPGEDFDLPMFEVTRDGAPVEYLGPIVKRPTPSADDTIVLQPGQSLSVPVELSGSYDFSAGGEYTIAYRMQSAHLFGPEQKGVEALVSEPVSISVESRAFSNVHQLAGDGYKSLAVTSSISYTGKCTASQQSTLLDAVNAATTYADGAQTYLNQTPSATPRYTTWFGAFSTGGWSTAKSHFIAIADAFHNKPLTLDCGCKKNYYAYVYPTQPYKIYVCKVFWTAPMTGTDSKGGTLIHEMSHFNATAGTDDWAYGQSAAKSLAISNPAKALDNADSHEYFAENTPHQN